MAQATPKISIAIPATTNPSAITTVDRTLASRTSGKDANENAAMPTNSGRWGRNRRRSRPPASRPAPSAATITPQAAAPPRNLFATIGPSTPTAPVQTMLLNENAMTITQSQVREANSLHPSRSSRSMFGASTFWARGSRIAASTAALAA